MIPNLSAARLLFALTAVSLWGFGCRGCLGQNTSPVDDPNSTIPSSCVTEPPVISPQKLDILFVIDNSSSMQEEQDGVARELTGFLEALRQSGGVPQDFNIGVITTSVYLHTLVAGRDWWRELPGGGVLRGVPDELTDGGLNLETNNQRVLSGVDPDLVSKFARLVRQGTQGSGQETPFEALRLALLTNANTSLPAVDGGSSGFLREGARLLVVVLTDEDDCSETNRPAKVHLGDDSAVDDCAVQGANLTPVSEYYRLFTQTLLEPDGTKKELIWTAIAPVGIANKDAAAILDNGQVRNVDCPTSNAPGTRHKEMAALFDSTLTNLDSICKSSYRDTLVHIAELAGVSQTIELSRVPDPRVLQLSIARKDGTRTLCTQLNAGFEVLDPGGPGVPMKLRFQNECRRRADDTAIEMRLLCAT